MRATISLDGIWEARLDAEASFGRRLAVPSPWQVADPTLRDHAGRVWYRREVDLPPDWLGHAIALRFGAVDYEARVWVNGQEVGGHVGGYTPFEVDLTAAARAGRNEVVLRVDDPADVGEIPHGKQGGRWYTPVSGPWQSVALLARPLRRVARVWISAGRAARDGQGARRLRRARRADAARPRGRRRRPGRRRGRDDRGARASSRWSSLRWPSRALVAGRPAPLHAARAAGRRRAGGAVRPAHGRGARRPDPAQRPAALHARRARPGLLAGDALHGPRRTSRSSARSGWPGSWG